MRDVAYVALGSNLGDRDTNLALGRSGLAALPRTRVLAVSSVEETAPIGPAGQGAYLNQMAAIETELSPRELLAALLDVEKAAGRVRGERWGARPLDLAIVAMRAQRSASPDCRVPHPELSNRDFWRRELDELGAHDIR